MTRTPRIHPLPEAEWSDVQRRMTQPARERYGMVFNVLKTMMRNMPLLESWNPLAAHLMSRSSLSPRQREILIMRVAWKTGSDYEWGQHVLMSRDAGLTAEDHRRIKAGADDPGWSALEVALIRAADELVETRCIGDTTWASLAAELGETQLLDVIFTVGQYTMLAMALNTIGVEREPGVPGFDC